MIIDGMDLSPFGTLFWENEFDWSPIAQTQDRSVTGAFLVQEQVRTWGRPIELVGGPESLWIPRADLLALKAKEEIIDNEVSVTLDTGDTFLCRFNRDTGSAIQAQRLTRFGPLDSDTLYFIQRIKLVTVEP